MRLMAIQGRLVLDKDCTMPVGLATDLTASASMTSLHRQEVTLKENSLNKILCSQAKGKMVTDLLSECMQVSLNRVVNVTLTKS